MKLPQVGATVDFKLGWIGIWFELADAATVDFTFGSIADLTSLLEDASVEAVDVGVDGRSGGRTTLGLVASLPEPLLCIEPKQTLT